MSLGPAVLPGPLSHWERGFVPACEPQVPLARLCRRRAQPALHKKSLLHKKEGFCTKSLKIQL